ncbi:hypothetical protein RUM43_001714 [Polyplax serrata]|uniref:Uncharacterized protein n=1 Tax=Polyplax serrata TaxID=468196 RepID=A0AAN8SER2_POLSC
MIPNNEKKLAKEKGDIKIEWKSIQNGGLKGEENEGILSFVRVNSKVRQKISLFKFNKENREDDTRDVRLMAETDAEEDQQQARACGIEICSSL